MPGTEEPYTTAMTTAQPASAAMATASPLDSPKTDSEAADTEPNPNPNPSNALFPVSPNGFAVCLLRCQSLECMMFLLNIILLGAEALMILNLILTTSKEERARLPENNLLKIFAADKEKASLWCARDHLTKRNWQWPMNEEDIIDTLFNSVTVHETKLKVDNICGET